ncbi:cytochrome c biogenesis CcdA family protein [Glutamicibacter sp. JL.03c]|uniref:cytochrome c biogenesis CcdA family protein n=1 Tax=Glutamicibacter sp. JL.03c TaxID=2984842 RepID=UPI0021F778A9|nr:cytochrome c biogenesis CcdA family protein [Glutamicibacter sp. JL.03c]UYQ77732.1 cytochrome c biogenesis CcdA family protein [Glutamicibacter sp. JL.03c]
MSINYLSAFLGGILTLFSPCSVMLLPAFFSYAFAGLSQLISRTGLFYLGLISTLVPLGALAGTLGALVNKHRDLLVTTSAIVVITLGVMMLLNLNFRFPGKSTKTSTTPLAVYLLGTIYGLSGVCAGPLLGAALAYASFSGNPIKGGTMLLFFAAGMALPLLLLALLWRRLPIIQRVIRPRKISLGRWQSTWTTLISGGVTIALGILLLLSRGTTELAGLLGASDQIAIESAAREASVAVPDFLTVGLSMLLLLAAWLIIRRKPKNHPVPTTKEPNSDKS